MADVCCNVVQEEDLAMMAAQQYFIQHSNNIMPERLSTLVGSYIPDALLQMENAADMWIGGIIEKLQSPYFKHDRITPAKVC